MVLTWEPIADLPQDWSALTDGELGPLLQFWNDQRADLEQSDALAEFSLRLAREWSIETGQIEGIYNLDRGVTETLIERGINADLIPAQPGQKLPELIATIIQDHADVLEGLFQFVKGDRKLSKGYIHELHAALLRHQETAVMKDQFGNLFASKLLRGKYKERPNNPKKPDGTMHQYCPPEQADPEMERLLAMHEEHIKKGVPVEIAAAWLHHRFTQIHPYQDGNGRVARALASLVFIKAGWFPVVVTRDDRPSYIDALEVADEGDLSSLVSFLAHIQKRQLTKAMQAIPAVRPVHSVDEAIAAAKRVLNSGKSADPAAWIKARNTASHLIDVAAKRLEMLKATLENEIASTRNEFRFTIQEEPDPQDRDRILALYIETEPRGTWGTEVRLEIVTRAVGSKFRGLIEIGVIFEDHVRQVVSEQPFQTNYAESYENAERRFRPWLEESLINALTTWRKGLQ
ncbi:MAG TPA: Fic family protein [Candidatus Saccharimonadales bacterium]|jgi:Fic family protein|nr:Fic family protein [Candidatus Saccharimonadales bacterium]